MFFSVKVKILWAFVLLLYAQRRQVKAETIDVNVYTDNMLKDIKQQLTIFQDKYDEMKRQIPNNPSNDKNVQDEYGSEELSDIYTKLTILLGFRQTREQSDKFKEKPCKCENIDEALNAFADKLKNQLTEELKPQFQKLPKKSDFCTFGKELTKHLSGNLKTHDETQNEQLVKSSTNIDSRPFETSQNEQRSFEIPDLPNSCSAAIRSGNGAGDYKILISNKPTAVYCDQRGRMMIQHQMQGPKYFFHCDWSQYRSGFGEPKSQYWFGLQNLHLLTTSRRYELHIDMVDFDNVFTQVQYDHFEIGGESDRYRLNKLDGFSGNQTDNFFGHHINMPFTTRDKYNDQDGGVIVEQIKSGWWFDNQLWVGLNMKVQTNKNEINWYVLHWEYGKPLKEVRMYIKLYEV